jgi:protein SFI1
LTVADVAILHDIVVHAQELLPSLPERERLPTNALFHAYYSILPSIGIDADHDSRYARILFKIGGTRSNGSLYEKFEAVLARMGIEIQFDPENEGEGSATKERIDQSSEQPLRTESARPVAGQRGRKSSNSENPALGPELKHEGGDRSRRSASSSTSTAHSENDVSHLNTPLCLPYETPQLSIERILLTQSHDGEQTTEKDGLREWLNENAGNYPKRTRTRSLSTHGSMHIRRRSPPPQHDVKTKFMPYPELGDLIVAEMDQHRNLDDARLNETKPFAPISEDLMDTKVTLIRKLHMENLAHQILIRWHHETMQLLEDNNNLDTIAKYQDRRVLLRQAFDSWHMGVGERRRIAETERFFTHLEKRAGRARDFFLIAKALTHWASSASKEMQRTSAARRHILRTRYFSAWRDMTAVNELKVRRQVFRKFFALWQRRLVTASLSKEKAIIYFTDNLVQRVFWAWFWAFCERRAPIWRTNRLLARQMVQWARVAYEQKEQDKAAVDYHHHKTKQKTFHLLSKKAQVYAMQIRQANEYRTISLCRKTLGVWQHASALLPQLQYLSRKVGSRLKYYSLELWTLRARQEAHARAIDRSKIMREAWVTWNDKLRCRSLQSKMDNRLVLQGLYKWVLGERLILVRRLMEYRMMQTSVHKLSEIWQNSTAKESRDLYLAERTFDRRLTSSTLQNWRARLQNHLQHQRLAVEFNAPLVLTTSLARWTTQTLRIRQLQSWAEDGEFYFLASNAIKSWKNATEKVRREKRRLAYTQFRRRYKIGLARKVFSRWHQQANSITDSDRLAVEVYQNKSVVFCVEIFDRWRARVEEIAELNLVRERLLLERHLNKMKLSLLSRRGGEVEAAAFFEEHATALCMKKWGRVNLQLRARQHLVFELREKHLKKTTRRVLAHWLQRTSQRQYLASTRNHKEDNLPLLDGSASWIESGDDGNVNEWGNGADDVMASTPMPGYLSTPSRRMSRAKATARLPSTTPSAALSTPVERQLRAQYSGGPLSSFRRRIGRSLLGREGTPLDLEDESGIRIQEDAI